MLKRIRINNFTTFFKPTEVDFTSTNYKFLSSENVGKNKILKGCLFVGENASGKTMLLKSIRLLLDFLFDDNNDANFFRYKSFYTNEPMCSLEYTFVINNKEIIYSYDFSKNKFLSEKMFYDGKEILNRLGETATINFNDRKDFKNVSEKMLFLRRVYFDTEFYGDKTLIKWFNFLKNSVYINCFNQEIKSYIDKSFSVYDLKNIEYRNKINDFFSSINYRQKIDILKNDNDEMPTVFFIKDGTNTVVIDFFESTGNNVLIGILPAFFHAIENNCMIIFDEFSSGLHNELEECLIKYFFHYAKNSQLFFTSHSTNILNNTILRPDQVYSVNFDPKKGAYLKRFSEEMPRESQNLEKMYLNGVFDGVPRYNKFFKD